MCDIKAQLSFGVNCRRCRMTSEKTAVLHQAKSIAEAKGISFSAVERPALDRVIVQLDKGKVHWVNECRDDEAAGVWLSVLKKGVDYLCRKP